MNLSGMGATRWRGRGRPPLSDSRTRLAGYATGGLSKLASLPRAKAGLVRASLSPCPHGHTFPHFFFILGRRCAGTNHSIRPQLPQTSISNLGRPQVGTQRTMLPITFFFVYRSELPQFLQGLVVIGEPLFCRSRRRLFAEFIHLAIRRAYGSGKAARPPSHTPLTCSASGSATSSAGSSTCTRFS